MRGALISWVNHAENSAASIDASSEAAGFGARSLLTPQIADVWRSGTWGETTITVDADLGADREIGVVAVAAPRDGLLPATAATVALTASTVSQSGTDVLDIAAAAHGMAPWGVWAWAASAPVTARYVRLSFAGTAGDTYLQLGRLWIGPALVTEHAEAFGASFGAQDFGSSERAGMTGVRYAMRGQTTRSQQWSLDALTEAEAGQLELCAAEAGTTGQVFVARRWTSPGQGMFAAFAQPLSPAQVGPNVWRAALSIVEDR